MALGLIRIDGGLSTLCHSWGFPFKQRVRKLFPGPGYLHSEDSPQITFTGKFVYMAHHFIFPRLNPYGLRVNRDGWWFNHSVLLLRVCLSTKMLKKLPWPGYLWSRNGVVWRWNLLVNLYIWFTILSKA